MCFVSWRSNNKNIERKHLNVFHFLRFSTENKLRWRIFRSLTPEYLKLCMNERSLFAATLSNSAKKIKKKQKQGKSGDDKVNRERQESRCYNEFNVREWEVTIIENVRNWINLTSARNRLPRMFCMRKRTTIENCTVAAFSI